MYKFMKIHKHFAGHITIFGKSTLKIFFQGTTLQKFNETLNEASEI